MLASTSLRPNVAEKDTILEGGELDAQRSYARREASIALSARRCGMPSLSATADAKASNYTTPPHQLKSSRKINKNESSRKIKKKYLLRC